MGETSWLERGQRALDGSFPVHWGKSMVIAASLSVIPFNLLELMNSKRLCAAVVFCDSVEDLDGLGVSTLTNQILRGFVQVEEKESPGPENKSEGAHGVHEISPSHVVFFSALSRRGCCWTGEIWEEAPGCCCRDDLAKRPPDAENDQQVLVSSREKFEEDGTVHRH